MNVRIKHTMSFTAGVFYGGEMRMNHYSLTLHMITNSTEATNHNTAFERIKYFVYNCLDSTIFINQAYVEQCQKFGSAGITVTTMPGEPVDQLVGLMLYYKLNAIMEDRILVDETEISSMLGENMIYMHSDNEQIDIGSIPAWWNTADLTHSDYVALDADKIVNMHAHSVWRDLELNWNDESQSTLQNDNGNIVVFADFKPDNDTK